MGISKANHRFVLKLIKLKLTRYIYSGGSGGLQLLSVEKISSDPSQAQVDQKGHLRIRQQDL